MEPEGLKSYFHVVLHKIGSFRPEANAVKKQLILTFLCRVVLAITLFAPEASYVKISRRIKLEVILVKTGNLIQYIVFNLSSNKLKNRKKLFQLNKLLKPGVHKRFLRTHTLTP